MDALSINQINQINTINGINKIWRFLETVDEQEERLKKDLEEAARREHVLLNRLSAREQELQDVAAVAVNYRKQQACIIQHSYTNKSAVVEFRDFCGADC